MKRHIPVILLLAVSLCGCQSENDEPFDTDEPSDTNEPQPHYENLEISGETAVNGIYDPSIEYHNGTGWMAYSAVEAPKYVHTRLAKTTDHGKTWVFITTINKAVDDTVLIDRTPVEGVWRHEVPALVYDPEDPGKEWKLYWHKYFTRPPYEAEDRVFHYGWIAYKYAPAPEGPWSQEIPLFGAGVFPPEPFETLINVSELHRDLRECIVYTEPGILFRDGVLYMSLNGHVIKEGRNIGNVFLIASHDHGNTWEYVNMLLTPDDAQQFDSLYFTGSSLAAENNRVFLLACPEDPSSQMHHRGTCIFEFTDIKKGRLNRDKTGLIIHKYLRPTRMSGGQSDYDEQNTYGGIVMPQRDSADYPEVFQIFNTNETIV